MIWRDLWQEREIFWSLSVKTGSKSHPTSTGTGDNHSPPSSTDINNECSYTSIPATCLHGMQGGKYTFNPPLYSVSMNSVRTLQTNKLTNMLLNY
jgi:hypothetical protein